MRSSHATRTIFYRVTIFRANISLPNMEPEALSPITYYKNIKYFNHDPLPTQFALILIPLT